MKNRRAFSKLFFSAIFVASAATHSRAFAQTAPVFQPWPTAPVTQDIVFTQNGVFQSPVSPIGAGNAEAVLPPTRPVQVQRYPYLITRPGDRDRIRSMPIEQRPNRIFHVYGNAVRAGILPHGPVGRAIFGD